MNASSLKAEDGVSGLMSDHGPSQWEQDVAEAYVNDRALPRPKVCLPLAALLAAAFLAVPVLLTVVSVFLLDCAGLPPLRSSTAHPMLAEVGIFALFSALAFGACGRSIVVGLVLLYQHYAPEDVRRRCLFMPTCSEYAILAVRKYGVVRGGLRAIERLLRRCRGSTYSIDYP